MTQSLPASALGDMPLLPLGLVRALLLAPIVLLLLALLWWLIRRFSRPKAATGAAPVQASTTRKGDFVGLLEGLLEPFFASGDIRGGLHELATAIRARLEQLDGEEREVLTVDEILPATALKVDELLVELRTRQFSKSVPQSKHLRRLAESAGRVLAKKR